jgi:hypothetical protein
MLHHKQLRRPQEGHDYQVIVFEPGIAICFADVDKRRELGSQAERPSAACLLYKTEKYRSTCREGIIRAQIPNQDYAVYALWNPTPVRKRALETRCNDGYCAVPALSRLRFLAGFGAPLCACADQLE